MFSKLNNIKFKKTKKGKLLKYAFNNNCLNFGVVGLKSLESGFINSRQLESAKRVIVRKLQKKGKLWLRICPNHPITLKPIGSRMGKGKGEIAYWGVKVKGGNVLFELCGVSLSTAFAALIVGGSKLPVKTLIFS